MTKLGMRRTTPKKGLKKHLPSKWELDRLFSNQVRAIGKCEYCDKVLPKERLECHHFIPRVYLQTRYEPDNGCSVESSCHGILQNNARENEAFFIKLRGRKRVEELFQISRTYQKFDKEAVMEKLKCL